MNLTRKTSFLFFLVLAAGLLAFQPADRSFDEQEMAEYAENPQFAKYLELNVQPPSIWDQMLWWLERLWAEFWSDPLRADLTWFIIAMAVLGVGVFYLLKLGFTKAVVTSQNHNHGSLHISPNSSIDYQIEMKNALLDKDFRLAIRFMYLDVLLGLSSKGLIKFQDWKTPLDYQLELPEQSRESYQKLASLFEYSWYGDFKVDRSDFDKGTNYAQMLDELEP